MEVKGLALALITFGLLELLTSSPVTAGSALGVGNSPQVQLQFRVVIPQRLYLGLEAGAEVETHSMVGRGQDLTAVQECAGSVGGPVKTTVLRSGSGRGVGTVEPAELGCQKRYYTISAP